MKKIILRGASVVVLMAIMLLSLVGCENANDPLKTPTDRFFVNDYAELLTEADDETIYNMGVVLQEKTTAQAVVVTVESLDDEPIEDVALKIGRQWGVGDKEKDNGIVILLSELDREVYIAVGYGLEGALPDSKVGRIIDIYGIPYLSSDNFSAGLVSIYNAVINEIYIEYGIQTSENYTPIDQIPQNDENEFKEILISWLVFIAISVAFTFIFGKRGGVYIYSGGRSFGSFGGGSSSSGFRGGGGSFGGGGSGRSF